MNISIGTSFGLVSGIMTALGLILSNLGAKLAVRNIILTLVSLSISDGLSDALGIFYGSYADDKDMTKSSIEGGKAFIGKCGIPLVFALVFFLTNNLEYGSKINILVGVVGMIILMVSVFKKQKLILLNSLIFIVIVIVNYFIGKLFRK